MDEDAEEGTAGVTRRQRILAIVALTSFALLGVAVAVILWRHAAELALGLIGVVVAVSGAWWTITERWPRRGIGMAGIVVGTAALAVALVRSFDGSQGVLLRAAVLAALFGLATATARASLVDDIHAVERRQSGMHAAPRHPVLICNPWSGGGKVGRFGLLELAGELGIETVLLDRGLDLEQLARDAIDRGADCLGMAGGDGSQALVASIAVEHDIPFVCISAGTRNHFALDLGIDREDPRDGMRAFGDAVERRVDYATVNGRLFVNNVSLGVYATIVQEEGYRDAKAETSMELLPELLGRTEHPFDLQFTTPDGVEVDGSFLIMVSNNPYVLGATFDVAQRRRLDSGSLGVFAVSAATGTEAARVVMLALAGQQSRRGRSYEFTAPQFEVRSRSGTAYAGVDGEALELETPLEFRIHPERLRMLVPAGNLAVARRRRARDVHVGDLVSLARGADPEATRAALGRSGASSHG